jgi:hypothetical protein
VNPLIYVPAAINTEAFSPVPEMITRLISLVNAVSEKNVF